jgi:hypothetical protein
MVSSGPLLGDAGPEDCRSDSGHGQDSPCDGTLSVRNVFRNSADRAGGLVSSDHADCFRRVQHPCLIP